MLRGRYLRSRRNNLMRYVFYHYFTEEGIEDQRGWGTWLTIYSVCPSQTSLATKLGLFVIPYSGYLEKALPPTPGLGGISKL